MEVNGSSRRSVLILGWIPRIVTTIARSLHKRGIEVDVADCVSGPKNHSSAVREFVRLPFPRREPAEFLSELRRVILENKHEILIPTDDLAIAAIMEHYQALTDLVHIACPPPEIMRRVLNKQQTLETAERCGIRAPRTLVVSNSRELPDGAQLIPFPWILKPAEKEQRFEEFASRKIENMDDIARLYPVAREFTPQMLLQEFCPGVGVGVEMLMHQGECLACFQHRRLKELPYSGGVAVTAIAELPDSKLGRSSLALLRALNWEGIAMVEYRVNPRGGEPVLMEVNGRYWGTISLPVAAGMDFPWYHWQVMHSEWPEIPTSYAAGKRWRWIIGYLDRFYRLFIAARHSKEARRVLTHDLLHLPGDFSFNVIDATFKLSDPLPALLEVFHAVKWWVSHSFEALVKRGLTRSHLEGLLPKRPSDA